MDNLTEAWADLDDDDLGNACDSDADGDGYSSPQDCDDFQASANPGTVEISDGIDNDCDCLIDNSSVYAVRAQVKARGWEKEGGQSGEREERKGEEREEGAGR